LQKPKQLTHLNFAKGFRGGERQTYLLIEELAKRGYQQQIVTRKKSELANRLEGIENLRILRISKPYIFNLLKIKDTFLLHAHETKAAQFCYFANYFFNIPYVITRRVDNPISNNVFNKNIYENSTSTIVLSNAIKREVLKISRSIDVNIIPSSYTKFQVNNEEVINIKNRFKDKFLIGNIGELDNNHKGQYYLIEALKKIVLDYPNIHLILLGKGRDEEKYKEQAKGLKNITFEGFVDNVGDYITCFDLFVFPSLNEGLGSILFDVIQAKVPIIASNVGGIPDIITHEKSGLLFPTKDTDAIYNAIEKLYLSEDLRAKFANEADKTIENFSITKMADEYEKVYKV